MWKQRLRETTIDSELAAQFNLSPVVASLFASRGISSADEINYWLNGTLADLADPFLFNEMDKTLERIMAAIDAGEQITVYGDYDADGITSTVVLVETLQILGAEVNYYIPSRFKDGYGPNLRKYEELIAAGTKLLITVDNGITGATEIDEMAKRGVDVIVTDHHTIPARLPLAYSIIHPKLSNQSYPFHDYSGVGVAYSLARALMDGDPLEDLLDLVAIGTIADLVPLRGENHLLVKYGIEVIKQQNRLGLNALIDVAKIQLDNLTAQDISFGFAPRLNSIGRLDDANKAVELLLAEDEEVAHKLAQELEDQNVRRKEISEEAFETAQQLIAAQQLDKNRTLVVVGPDFHEGVLGIVASRLIQRYHRPTIVLTKDSSGLLKGSGRSVEGFDIFAALEPLSHTLLSKFGGHTMACGLSMPEENLAEFRQAFEQTYVPQTLETSNLYDTSIDLDELNIDLYNQIMLLGPFGTDNEEPVFRFNRPLISNFKKIGSNQQYFKASLKSDTKQQFDLVSFNLANFDERLLNYVADLYGRISLNIWRGQAKLQIIVADFRYELPATTTSRVVDLRSEQTTLHVGDSYLFYHEDLAENFCIQEQLDRSKILLVDYDEPRRLQSAALMELPQTPNDLRQLFKTYEFERVLLKFNYDNLTIDQIPDERIFKNVLKYVYQHPGLTIASYNLANKYLETNESTLKFIFRVFFELNFVKIDEFKIVPNKDVVATTLTSSKYLQLTEQRLKFKEQMKSLSSRELVRYIESLLQ